MSSPVTDNSRPSSSGSGNSRSSSSGSGSSGSGSTDTDNSHIDDLGLHREDEKKEDFIVAISNYAMERIYLELGDAADNPDW